MVQAAPGASRPSLNTDGSAKWTAWSGARGYLSEAWGYYRSEILVAVSATAAVRISTALIAVVLTEVVLTSTSIALMTIKSLGYGKSGIFSLMTLTSLVVASFGHHLLVGVLERVVAADRFGHGGPRIRTTLAELPWVRLLCADVILTVVGVALVLVFVVPYVIVAPFLVCVMPLLSMRHENLRSVWRASFRLVRGSWKPVAFALLIGKFAEFVLMQSGTLILGLLFDHHALETILHGLGAIVIVPFGALIPVVITFDLLKAHNEVPATRY